MPQALKSPNGELEELSEPEVSAPLPRHDRPGPGEGALDRVPSRATTGASASSAQTEDDDVAAAASPPLDTPVPPAATRPRSTGTAATRWRRAAQIAREFAHWLRDSGVAVANILIVLGVAGAGWAASFLNLHVFALERMHLVGLGAWLVPVTFDGAAAGLSLSAARAAINGRSAAYSRTFVVAFTMLSSWINYVHIDDPVGAKVAALLPISAVVVWEAALAEMRAAWERNRGTPRPRLHPLRWLFDFRGTKNIVRSWVLDLPLPAHLPSRTPMASSPLTPATAPATAAAAGPAPQEPSSTPGPDTRHPRPPTDPQPVAAAPTSPARGNRLMALLRRRGAETRDEQPGAERARARVHSPARRSDLLAGGAAPAAPAASPGETTRAASRASSPTETTPQASPETTPATASETTPPTGLPAAVLDRTPAAGRHLAGSRPAPLRDGPLRPRAGEASPPVTEATGPITIGSDRDGEGAAPVASQTPRPGRARHLVPARPTAPVAYRRLAAPPDGAHTDRDDDPARQTSHPRGSASGQHEPGSTDHADRSGAGAHRRDRQVPEADGAANAGDGTGGVLNGSAPDAARGGQPDAGRDGNTGDREVTAHLPVLPGPEVRRTAQQLSVSHDLSDVGGLVKALELDRRMLLSEPDPSQRRRLSRDELRFRLRDAGHPCGTAKAGAYKAALATVPDAQLAALDEVTG